MSRKRPGLLSSSALALVLSLATASAATFTVTSTADTNTAGTLRFALNNAGDGDTISVALASGSTIQLTGELPTITHAITLNGGGVTINGALPNVNNTSVRAFFVDAAGKSVAISNLAIINSAAVGGGGSGGGLGAGGALFAMEGNITLSNVTFAGNRAQGGAGGGFCLSAGCSAGVGGGGLGGNGAGVTLNSFYNGGGGGGIGTRANGGQGDRFGFPGGTGTLPGAGSGGSGGGVSAGQDGPSAGGTNGGGGGGGGSTSGGGGGGSNGGAGTAGTAVAAGNGGNGGFGGGGGGAGANDAGGVGGNGGNGGFGGGGGQGGLGTINGSGGNGGFGGGGGASSGQSARFGTISGAGGLGGYGGGNAGSYVVNESGGGGAGFGGAIFVCAAGITYCGTGATVTILNTSDNTIGTDNTAVGGIAQFHAGGAQDGMGAGGAIFLMPGTKAAFNIAGGTTTSILADIAGMTGDGGVAVTGGGTLALLNANNSFTGGVAVNAGALKLSSDSALGLGGTLALSNGTSVFFTAGGTYAHAVTVAGDPIFSVPVGQTVTWTGQISDGVASGDVEDTGGGTLVLANTANSYSGGTSVYGGSTLQAGADAVLGATSGALSLGNATSNGTFQFTNAFNLAATRAMSLGAGGGTIDTNGFSISIAQAISGAGGLTKIGAGTLALAGTSGYRGPTAVNAGTLQVTGSIASSSSLTIKTGATLTGGGIVPSTTITGGTLSPGLGLGTLTVAGNLSLDSASNYLVDISATAADLTSVSGSASVSGTLTLNPSGTGFTAGHRYTVLTATGGVSGSFALVSPSFGLLIPSLSQDTNNVYVNFLVRSFVSQLPAGASANTLSVATGLDKALGSTPVYPAPFLFLASMPGSQLASALNQLAGQSATAIQRTGLTASAGFMNLLNGFTQSVSGGTAVSFGPRLLAPPTDEVPMSTIEAQVQGGSAAPQGKARAWATAFGGGQHVDGSTTAGSAALDGDLVGLAAGIDMQVNDEARIGVAVANSFSSFGLNVASGAGNSRQYLLGAYGIQSLGQGYVSATGALGAYRVSTQRTLTVLGTDVLGAKFAADSYSARLEGGYSLDALPLTPYIGVQTDAFLTPNYTETALAGSGNYALSYQSHTAQDTHTELGARFLQTQPDDDDSWQLEGRLAWTHHWQTIGTPAAFASLAAGQFSIQGALPASDAALVSARSDWRLGDSLTMGVQFDGEMASNAHTLTGSGFLRYSW